MEASSFDITYCYPGSETLKNRFDERDPNILSQYERMYTAARLVDLLKKPIKGNFDIPHLQKIHRYIFQDIYSWAGKFRTVNISKEILFCDAKYIEKELTKIFLKLKDEHYLKDTKEADIPKAAAWYLGEINAIHPFREGNGRAQREFIRELLLPLGYETDYSQCEPSMMLYASIDAFAGNFSLMEQLFSQCIRKIKN
ncbi:MAG: Fic/DOC family protein [Succinivibrio sp.]